ncbi:MAG: hypothetical protein IH600_12225 [Bacteroidetes bacterium]|nr:hypothetical protein [Bacteroidota bacterium]
MPFRHWWKPFSAASLLLVTLSSCGDRSQPQQSDVKLTQKHPPVELQIEGSFVRVVCLAEHLDSMWALTFVDIDYRPNLTGGVEQVRTQRGFDRWGRWFKEMHAGDTLRIPLLALGASKKDIPEELQFLQNADTTYLWEVKNGVATHTGYSVWPH